MVTACARAAASGTGGGLWARSRRHFQPARGLLERLYVIQLNGVPLAEQLCKLGRHEELLQWDVGIPVPSLAALHREQEALLLLLRSGIGDAVADECCTGGGPVAHTSFDVVRDVVAIVHSLQWPPVCTDGRTVAVADARSIASSS